MNKQVLLDVALLVDDSDVAQPVDRVRIIETALRSDQFLLHVHALDLKRKKRPGFTAAVDTNLICCERVGRFARLDLHRPAYAKTTCEKASDEDGEQRSVHDVSAKPVPSVALSKHCHLLVFFVDASSKAVLAPHLSNVLCNCLWISSLDCLVKIGRA